MANVEEQDEKRILKDNFLKKRFLFKDLSLVHQKTKGKQNGDRPEYSAF